MDGWLGPKLTVRTSSSFGSGFRIVGTGCGIREPAYGARPGHGKATRDGRHYSASEKRTGSPPIG